MKIQLKILETPQEIGQVEELQRQVWSGSETEIVPAHMLLAVIHNGGILIGAVETGGELTEDRLVGFVFGFPGLYLTSDGLRLKHASHMLGVLPSHRDKGIGFALKQAQWQMVRQQGVDRVTWTYDPLLSRNAYLNISRLGAVCNTYLQDFYGELRDGMNTGLSSDRFQVDWWVNSARVTRRMSNSARQALDLAHYLAGGTEVINPTHLGKDDWPRPPQQLAVSLPDMVPDSAQDGDFLADQHSQEDRPPLLLLEIPANFSALKAEDIDLAAEWRMHTRSLFADLFVRGYWITDFVYLPGRLPRSFYVLTDGERTL